MKNQVRVWKLLSMPSLPFLLAGKVPLPLSMTAKQRAVDTSKKEKELKMIRKVVAILLVVLVVLVGSLSLAYAGGPAVAPVNWHPQSGSGAVPGAWAQVVRNDNGASYTFHAADLNPGHVYTLWVVVVNNPAACGALPCTAADLILNSSGVDSDVTYGAGHVAGASGRGSFGGHISTGALSNAWFGNGFTNADGAEIHLVLNDHGPMIPDLVSNMLGTYRGGCTDISLPPIFPATAFADGIPGPNTCRLYQTAIFQ